MRVLGVPFLLTLSANFCLLVFKRVGIFAPEARLASLETGVFALDRARLVSAEASAFVLDRTLLVSLAALALTSHEVGFTFSEASLAS